MSYRLLAALALVALTGAPGLSAQEGASLPLTWENIFTRSTGVRGAALSPDGRTVAVAASTTSGAGIFLVPVGADDGARPRPRSPFSFGATSASSPYG